MCAPRRAHHGAAVFTGHGAGYAGGAGLRVGRAGCTCEAEPKNRGEAAAVSGDGEDRGKSHGGRDGRTSTKRREGGRFGRTGGECKRLHLTAAKSAVCGKCQERVTSPLISLLCRRPLSHRTLPLMSLLPIPVAQADGAPRQASRTQGSIHGGWRQAGEAHRPGLTPVPIARMTPAPIRAAPRPGLTSVPIPRMTPAPIGGAHRPGLTPIPIPCPRHQSHA